MLTHKNVSGFLKKRTAYSKKMKEPTIRQLRYFIGVADTGQVSRAARELNVSQSAITTAVKQLEEITGIQLFQRHPTGLKLTYEGNILLDHARRIIANVEEAIKSPRKFQKEVKGKINLAMTYTVAGYFLQPYIERFNRKFPNVKTLLVEAPRHEIEDGLVTGKFDCAVMLTANIVDQESIAYEILMKSKRRLWLPSQHKFINQQNITLKDVSEEPYIMLTVDEASNTAQRYWNRANYQPNTVFRTSSVEAVRSMVAGGMGVTILSDMVYRPWSLEGHRVEVIPIADEIPTMDVGIAWANNVKQTPAVTAFREFMNLRE